MHYKKIAALLLVFTLAFSLTACDSSDYKKATELYNTGNFEEALAIFTELEDYEDSANMALACKYGMADSQRKSGDYEAAIEGFEALGDFEDSRDKILLCRYEMAVALCEEEAYAEALPLLQELGDYDDAAQYRADASWVVLYDYIEANGADADGTKYLQYLEDKKESGSVTRKGSCIGTVEDEPDQLLLYGVDIMKMSGFFECQYNFGIGITRGSSEGLVFVSSETKTTYNGAVGRTQDSGTGTIDISTATKHTSITLDSYSYQVRDIYGQIHTRSTPDATTLSANQERYVRLLEQVPMILEETGLGITLADLGFTALDEIPQ